MSGAVWLTLLFVAYALFARRLTRSPLTGPMLFMGAGVIAALDLLGRGRSVDAFGFVLESGVVQGFLEATLVIILFSDAVAIDARVARREAFLPSRLLGIGLPLTIVLGIVLAMVLFPDIGFWPAAVIAVVLAPTDAALGQAVVMNEDVPVMVRQGLGIESGLNDGIAVPFLTIAIAGATNEMQTGSEIVTVFAREIGLAVVVGLAVGLIGAVLVTVASVRGWAGVEGRQVAVVMLALLCFVVADQVGGSGFIAAFVGGLAFGARARSTYPDVCHFADGVGHLLTMLAFFIFGSLIVVPALDGNITWRIVLYAVASLTVIRMIPVAVSLVGTGLRAPTQLFVSWFGPRGLASLVFVGTVVVETQPEDTPEIVAIAAMTVMMSVILHGLTAWPSSVAYARWFRGMQETGAPMVEEAAVASLAVPRGKGLRRSGPGPDQTSDT